MTEKFSYYDAIAHLIPGTVGSLFLLYTFDLLGIALPKLDVGPLGGLGIGIAVAYTLGNLLQSLASSFEPFYYTLWGGKPSVKLLTTKSRHFSDAQRQQLVKELIKFFRVSEEIPKERKESQNFYQRLFERCMALCSSNKLGRVDAFDAVYGFHRVLLTTFLLAFVAYVIIGVMQSSWALSIPPAKMALLKSLILLTGVGLGIEFIRARKL